MPSSLKLISGMAHSEAILAQNAFKSVFASGLLNFGQLLPHLLVASIPIFFPPVKINKENVNPNLKTSTRLTILLDEVEHDRENCQG